MVDDTTTPEGRAKGGYARADALSDDERHKIAKKAAEARWSDNIEIAGHAGVLEIGENTKVPCAVLKDGTRVISERAIAKAFGGKRGGSHWLRLKENPDGANLPVILSAKNIQPFITKDLLDGFGRRRIYCPKRWCGCGKWRRSDLVAEGLQRLSGNARCTRSPSVASKTRCCCRHSPAWPWRVGNHRSCR